jgi:DNA-binding beta-propeller fold protein YncE
VIVRPLDLVQGYLVPDGRPARALPALLSAGPAFPGPVPTQLWMSPVGQQAVLALINLDGRRLGDVIDVPEGSSPLEATPDGGGYLLFSGIGGVYDARPDGMRRISTGSLLATGPTGWLVVECDERYRCQNVLIGRVDGSRRIVPDVRANRDPHGVLSPDGSTAAMLQTGPQGESQLYLLDLVSGRRRVVPVTPNPDAYDGAVAFSPDSRWLFAVTAGGTVSVVNSRTAAVRPLGIALPSLSQLVVRPAPRGRPALSARSARSSRLASSARQASSARVASSSAAARALAVNQALTRTCCRPTPDQ